ncbi:tripartite tricarboxylate transporter permease [Saccharopolyspora hirsuta]|uniref:Tripartite tricarboxylate transporter permease n=1 Tax=Saccharopolyspora hirsuta TaxID=1837 RepID=A0A5M7C4N7_SACHI|nr:tripartite tricarboxylate transporter permease [Saccharopolyspora hirsuta]KAA5835238.1 tripartite tricarboxylate transporter permease [Saccharopolyspora hirsuta]
MEAWNLLLAGFADALTPLNLLLCLVGVALGTAVGVLPGLGSSMAVALLLPLTFTLEPTGAFIMLAGVYFGGQFGGSTTAILLNTPGQSSSMATAFEGFLMARAGRAPQALATAAIGSFVGGTIACIAVVFFAPFLVDFALEFGPAEYFALAVFAFAATAAVVADSAVRGLIALGLGLALGVVGIDQQTGVARYTLGSDALLDGISVVVVTVGVLAIGEVLHVSVRARNSDRLQDIEPGRPWLGRADLRSSLLPWLRGTGIGLPFGAIPAGGSEIPTFLSLGLERRLAARRGSSQFGRGAIEGVAAPEAANNSTTAVSLVPLLGLGLPTSATTAVMLGAFQQYGMQPGPLLFADEGELVWALLASLFIGNVLLLVLNLPFAPLWAKLLRIPQHYLYAAIAVFATLGAYAAKLAISDVVLVYAVGLLSFLLRRNGVPLAPVLIGVILGPLAERELRRAMALGQGDPGVLLDSPIAVVLYAVLVVAVAGALLLRRRSRT